MLQFSKNKQLNVKKSYATITPQLKHVLLFLCLMIQITYTIPRLLTNRVLQSTLKVIIIYNKIFRQIQ